MTDPNENTPTERIINQPLQHDADGTQYHKMYDRTKIPQEVIDSVNIAIKTGLFREQIPRRKEIIQLLHNRLCQIYNIPPIEIEYVEGFESIGAFALFQHKLILNKTSLVTYLHEFYHYLAEKTGLENTEINARGWSISAYYLATPILCKSAIKRGLIIHQTEVTEE